MGQISREGRMTHSLKMDWAARQAATARELEVLWVTFVKLQRLRLETLTDLGADGPTAPEDPHLLAAILSPIAEELCRLALAAAKINAHCQIDLEYKAVMLAEYLSVEDESIQTALTRSLVRDIRNRRCDSHSSVQPEFQLSVASTT